MCIIENFPRTSALEKLVAEVGAKIVDIIQEGNHIIIIFENGVIQTL